MSTVDVTSSYKIENNWRTFQLTVVKQEYHKDVMLKQKKKSSRLQKSEDF
jgi:hypothetical protein